MRHVRPDHQDPQKLTFDDLIWSHRRRRVSPSSHGDPDRLAHRLGRLEGVAAQARRISADPVLSTDPRAIALVRGEA
jgi:hypothetical protein